MEEDRSEVHLAAEGYALEVLDEGPVALLALPQRLLRPLALNRFLF